MLIYIMIRSLPDRGVSPSRRYKEVVICIARVEQEIEDG